MGLAEVYRMNVEFIDTQRSDVECIGIQNSHI